MAKSVDEKCHRKCHQKQLVCILTAFYVNFTSVLELQKSEATYVDGVVLQL